MHQALLLFLLLACGLEGSIIHKHHKAKLVRVLRASEIEKTRLADGTKFERFIEMGEVPPLPIEEEEEADGLNDPRLGHIDKSGGIAIPVDSKGNILKGYEYLMKPITIDLDLDESELKGGPSGDSYELPGKSQNGELGQKDFKPYPNNQDMSPKQEFLPSDVENAGDEYDDVASEPREPLPNVPDLPKPDYSDSGEVDEDLKTNGDIGDDDGQESEDGDAVEPSRPEEVIYPNQPIEISPISEDDVNEASKTMDEVEKETEIRGDEESGGRGVDIPKIPTDEFENDRSEDDDGKGVDIPKNRVDESDSVPWDSIREPIRETNEKDKFAPDGSTIDSSEELTDEDMEDLAKDFGKEVFGNVMNKAKELGWNEEESNASEDDLVDPNSISARGEIIRDSDGSDVIVAGINDGVVLPEQEELTDEELARIAAESVKPVEPVAPEVPRPNVRGGRIGSGVQPDSATQHNIFIQFFIVSLAFLIL